jgi:hypothetical protein
MRCGVFQNPPIPNASEPIFEERFPIPGTGQLTTEPAAGTGFHRRGASSSGDFGAAANSAAYAYTARKSSGSSWG